MEAPPRLERLPARTLPGGLRLADASSTVARTLGLALLDPPPPGHALLIPRCRCVHTFGMRFAVDIVWIDAHGGVVEVMRDVGPRRLVRCRRARHVVEVAAGGADRLVAGIILGTA